MKYIFKRFTFGIIQHKDAEALLSTMAAKGYEFKGVGKNYVADFAMFERNEKAKELKYAVDPRHGMSEEEAKELYLFYGDMGWEHVDTYRKKLHIFVTKGESTKSLYTDELSRYESFSEAMRTDGEPYLNIVFALLGGLLARFLIAIDGISETNLLNYLIFVLCIILSLAGTTIAVDCFLYRARCKKLVARGEPIPENLLRRELNKWEFVVSIVALFLAPLAVAWGCSYLLWGESVDISRVVDARMLMWMLCWSLISVPLVLWSGYKSFLAHNRKRWQRINLVVGFLHYLNIYTFLNIYFRLIF